MIASADIFMGADASALSVREFSYAGDAIEEWGTGLLENYDVAIRLIGPGLEGARITNVNIPLNGLEELSDVKIWMSSDLKLDGKVNAPDILSASAEVNGGAVSFTLDSPYIIPADGVYVGCSFSVATLSASTKYPLNVSKGGNENSFFIHSSRKYSKWGNYDLNLSLDMTVSLHGDFYQDMVEVLDCKEVNVGVDEIWTPTISVRNLGTLSCQTLGYTLTLDSETQVKGNVILATPLIPSFTEIATVALESLPASEAGRHVWSVRVTAVNGMGNPDDANFAEGELYVWPYLPKRTPLMEEYTGTWCGWCPRGAVGMAEMQKKYGNDFVAIVYHTDGEKDPMVTSSAPTTVYDGAPWGVLDRVSDADPYYGFEEYCSSFEEGIDVAWLERKAVPSPVEIKAEAYWKDEDKNSVTVSADVKFVRDYIGKDIRIGVFLVADGLKGKTADWYQSNYYSGLAQYAEGGLKELYDAPRKLTDYPYNHVLIYSPDPFGTAGSLPENIQWLKDYLYQTELPLELAVNVHGESLVQDKDNLSVVVAVINASDNTVLNCKDLAISGASGVSRIENAEIVSVNYFDLLGRPLKASESSSSDTGTCVSKGELVIKVVTYSDGKTVASPIFKAD